MRQTEAVPKKRGQNTPPLLPSPHEVDAPQNRRTSWRLCNSPLTHQRACNSHRRTPSLELMLESWCSRTAEAPLRRLIDIQSSRPSSLVLHGIFQVQCICIMLVYPMASYGNTLSRPVNVLVLVLSPVSSVLCHCRPSTLEHAEPSSMRETTCWVCCGRQFPAWSLLNRRLLYEVMWPKLHI
jgi:hypothetical protein